MPRTVHGYMKMARKRYYQTTIKKLLRDVRTTPAGAIPLIYFAMMMDQQSEEGYTLLRDFIRAKFIDGRGIILRDKDDPPIPKDDQEANDEFRSAMSDLLRGTSWTKPTEDSQSSQ